MYEHYVNTTLAAERQATMRQAADRHRLIKAARRAGRAERPNRLPTFGRWGVVPAWFGRHQPAWRTT